jgi:hypothetical protein
MSGPLNDEDPLLATGTMGLVIGLTPVDYSHLFPAVGSGGNTSAIANGHSAILLPYVVNFGETGTSVFLFTNPDDTGHGATATYILRVTLTISNPNRTAPPPLISPAAKQALDIMTGQLDTLSRGFDMLNSANPYAAGLKSANWGASNAVNALSPQIGFANSVQQAVLSVEDTAVATLEGNPLAAVLGLVSSVYALTGLVTGALALDPPDGNFTTVFQPTNHSYAIAGATGVDMALTRDSIDYLDATLSMLIASERFQGATLAGDTASATLQTNAYNAALSTSLADASAMASDLTAFQAELVSGGYSDVSIGGGSLAAVQSELASVGTSDAFLTNLIANTKSLLGTTGAQSLGSQVLSEINAKTAGSVPGTVFGGIAGASGALTSYANGTLQCFLRGTLIRTAVGQVPVEHLAPGDRIVVAEGGDVPAIWIGHRRVDATRHPDRSAVWPIRIKAGTFAAGQPFRDLFLSPDHAVFVDGVLVPLKLLVNGASIVQIPRPRVTYYHVELPEHAVILAEGLPVESYLDVGDRANFSDQDVVRLFPDFAARLVPDVAMVWESKGAAPLVQTGAVLEALRASLAWKAGEDALRQRRAGNARAS